MNNPNDKNLKDQKTGQDKINQPQDDSSKTAQPQGGQEKTDQPQGDQKPDKSSND